MSEIVALPVKSKICKGCKIEKPFSEFYEHTYSKGGRVGKCKACYTKQRKNTKIGSLDGRLRSILANVVERRQKGMDITLFDLHQLWESQKGLCSYSGVPMTWDDSNKYTTVSIDRVDSSKGYVRGNVAFCCFIVNIMKTNMPVEHFLWWCRNISAKLGGSDA